MQNQPMQLDKKQFQELLKEIKLYNKLDLVAQTLQTKYAMETAGEDDEQRKKDAKRTNELLEQIAISVSGGKDTKNKASVTKIGSTRKKSNKEDEDGYRTLGDVKNNIKDDLKEFKREIKTGVAFGKRVGGGIKEAVTSPIQTMKKIGSGIAGFGKSAFGQTKDILSTPSDYKNPTMAALQQPLSKVKIDNPNIVNEPDEILAQEAENQSVTFKELLDVTKESLNQLKAIRGTLEGTPTTGSAQPTSKTPKTAPVAAAPAAAEEGGGSMIGDAIGGKVMKGVGGKILGGLKAGGAMLGKGALVAGKAVMGAALAKPALIAAGVGLAAYGAYKGYKALTGGSNDKGTDDGQAGKVETKESTISLANFAQNDPKGFEEYQKFIRDEMDKGEEQIEKDFKSGKKKGAKEVFFNELERDVQKKARDKFKDKMIAAGAIETKTSTKGEIKGKDGASPEVSADAATKANQRQDAVNKRTDELLAKAPANLKDDIDYQNTKREQAELEVKSGKTLSGEPLDSGYKENAQVSSKGGFGDKIGSFFGGIKDSVVGAAGTVGAAVSSKVDYIKDQYNRDLGASVADKQLDDEVERRAKAAGVERFSNEYNKINDQVRKEMVAKDPRAFESSETMVTTDTSLNDLDQTDKSGTLEKRDMQGGITAQKSLFGSTFLGSLFSKKGQTTGQFSSDQNKDERFTGDAAALGLGSDLGVDYEKRKSSSLLGERISSGSLFKRDKYKVTDTESGQKLNMSKSEYNKMQALVKEGKAEEAKKLFDEVNAREAAYVPEPGVSPYENMGQPPVQAAKPSTASAQVAATTIENQTMRDEAATGAKSTQPVVVSNVNNNSQNNFIPIKGEPRPGSRGSALDRYSDRVAAY